MQIYPPGVAEDKIIIKKSYVPHLVDTITIQDQDKVKHQENDVQVKDEQNSANGGKLRSRLLGSEKLLEKTDELENAARNLKFTAISETANDSPAYGRWVFLNVLNLKVLFLGALKTLPWYAIVLAFLAIPIDAIFKTKFVSILL